MASQVFKLWREKCSVVAGRVSEAHGKFWGRTVLFSVSPWLTSSLPQKEKVGHSSATWKELSASVFLGRSPGMCSGRCWKPWISPEVWVMTGHMDMQIAAPTEYTSEAETHESWLFGGLLPTSWKTDREVMQTPQTQLFTALMLQNSAVEVLLLGSAGQAASRISKGDGGGWRSFVGGFLFVPGCSLCICNPFLSGVLEMLRAP